MAAEAVAVGFTAARRSTANVEAPSPAASTEASTSASGASAAAADSAACHAVSCAVIIHASSVLLRAPLTLLRPWCARKDDNSVRSCRLAQADAGRTPRSQNVRLRRVPPKSRRPLDQSLWAVRAGWAFPRITRRNHGVSAGESGATQAVRQVCLRLTPSGRRRCRSTGSWVPPHAARRSPGPRELGLLEG